MGKLSGLAITQLVITALSILFLLWRRLLAKRIELRVVRKILDRERERSQLTRWSLIWRSFLIVPELLAWVWAVMGLLGLKVVLAGDQKNTLSLMQLELVLSVPMCLLLGLVGVARAWAIFKGAFRLRLLTVSGSKLEADTKGHDRVVDYLGTRMGDYLFSAPSALEQGKWYYAVIIDGSAALALPAARWVPDPELRKYMPAEEALQVNRRFD